MDEESGLKKKSSKTSRSERTRSTGPARPPAWARALERRLAPEVRDGVPSPEEHARLLELGIGAIVSARASRPKRLRGLQGLKGQPFDAELLALSPLYRRSRKLYLDGGGVFDPTLVSTPRTLSSPILLEPRIEYSPIERELVWAATDPVQAKDPSHLLTIRTFASSVFHEQSHRILWRRLPPPPRRDSAALRRYLNFVESLVIALDMALGDELGPALAATFYLCGAIYDPGTTVRRGRGSREYRNYLQATLHATYLALELYEPENIPRAIRALYPQLGDELAERAVSRAFQLDAGFVRDTNPTWQQRHRDAILARLARLRGGSWAPPSDPMDTREQYLFAEKWFDELGI
jgi:hypothetical protein